METIVLHRLPEWPGEAPMRFPSPFVSTPHPWAVAAAEATLLEVRQYMADHPATELLRQGKMFGVLVVRDGSGHTAYLRAFSAMLDGSYHHLGYVPPIFDMTTPDGYFRQEEKRISAMPKGESRPYSQALQRWLFSQYLIRNGKGETRDLLQLFADIPTILSEADYFSGQRTKGSGLPPSGAGECCAPKLLQAAYSAGLQPLCMAEFWVGAPPKTELRREGCFYEACHSKCRPILRFMLEGQDVADNARRLSTHDLADTTQLLYEDDWMLVVNKPSGLLSVDGTDPEDYSLTRWCRERWHNEWITPAHRLDQDTSGIVVLAKDADTLRLLQVLFMRRDILKRYEALLQPEEGAQIADEGTIRLPLMRNPLDRPRWMVHHEHGKPSVTRYVVRERRADGRVLVDFFPETGRTHQLRIHSAHPDGLNAPIVGDRLYGHAGGRLMLHAAELRFHHPVTGEELHFLAEKNTNVANKFA